MCFRLVPNLSTLDDLEWQKHPLAKVNKNSSAHQKNFNEDRLYCRMQNVGLAIYFPEI